jgi:ribonuclease BN (tRNA processing enzyme)
VQVTVLGKSPSWQDAGGACSGYLVRDEDTVLLLDCGNGVFSKLRSHIDYVDVDAVVISHLHADHMLDLVPYSYALTYAPRQQPVAIPPFWEGTDNPAKPQLHVPAGGRETFRRIVGAWGNEDLIENAFELREYDSAEVLSVGTMEIRFHPVPHYLPTHAIGVRSLGNGAGRMVYGADCSPTEELVEFARDTDLLIIEATLPRPERDGVRGHLTPAEAGDHGRRAGAHRLVITHISDEMDQEWARAEAESTFGGAVDVAREGATYEL